MVGKDKSSASKKTARKSAKSASASSAKSAAKTTKKRAAKRKPSPAARMQVSAMQRHEMIAEAAYLRASARDFEGGDPNSDWFEAEQEIDRMLGAGH